MCMVFFVLFLHTDLGCQCETLAARKQNGNQNIYIYFVMRPRKQSSLSLGPDVCVMLRVCSVMSSTLTIYMFCPGIGKMMLWLAMSPMSRS
jgi:hypothetical protein